jgi:hypothetical protein
VMLRKLNDNSKNFSMLTICNPNALLLPPPPSLFPRRRVVSVI